MSFLPDDLISHAPSQFRSTLTRSPFALHIQSDLSRFEYTTCLNCHAHFGSSNVAEGSRTTLPGQESHAGVTLSNRVGAETPVCGCP
ncbi:hypothetical protein AOLI_G00040750 [Acnodon oligacanthus]